MGAKNFDGSLDVNKAVEWLNKIEKVFASMEMSDGEKISSAKMFLQGVADSWMDRVRRLHGDEMTWQAFVTEFQKDYISKSYRKGKQDAFFRLEQGGMTVREYIDKFEDLYRFVADMLPSEEYKYDQFLSGLHVTIRSGLASFEGTTYRSLVEKAMEVEKLKKEEKDIIQKSRKHGQSSYHNIDNRFTKRGGGTFQTRTGPSIGRGFYTESRQASQSTVQQPVGSFRGVQGLTAPQRFRSQCPTCGRYHEGECKMLTNVCYECGEMGHFRRECPRLIQPASSEHGFTMPKGQRGGRTQSRGRPIVGGAGTSGPSGATSAIQPRQGAEANRPQTQVRIFAMTQ